MFDSWWQVIVNCVGLMVASNSQPSLADGDSSDSGKLNMVCAINTCTPLLLLQTRVAKLITLLLILLLSIVLLLLNQRKYIYMYYVTSTYIL